MNLLSTLIVLFGLAIIALLRFTVPVLLKRQIERSIDAKFDRELESFRSQLRLDEARLTSLQGAVLNGSASRSSLLATRRMEAIEAIWQEICRLGRFRMIVSMMQIMKIDSVAAKAKSDPKVRQWVETMMGGLELKDLAGGTAVLQRPYVTDRMWAAYSAYSAVIGYAVGLITLIKGGIETPRDFIDNAALLQMVKEALPHQAEYIEEKGETAAFFLIDQLHNAALLAVRAEIDGRDVDEQTVERAQRVIKLVEEANRKSHGMPSTSWSAAS